MPGPDEHFTWLSPTSEHRSLRRQGNRSRDSEDTLIPRSESEKTLVDLRDMATPVTHGEIERRKSFGIGGAGNIR
jgi:hypothetical protein